MRIRHARRRVTRRRRRNPVGKHHSAAMRAKIGRAVRASMRKRSSSSSVARRRPSRRRRNSLVVRSSPVSRRRSSVARRSVRRVSRRRKSGFSLGSASIGLKSLFDKQTLMTAGGAVAGQFVTRFVLGKWGASLPMIKNADGSVNQYGLIGYQLVIPLVGAMALKKFQPALAKGMLLGGVISAINTGINLMQGLSLTPTAGAGEYLDAAGVNALPPGYSGVDQFSSAMNPVPAFSGDAWSK